MVPRVIDDRDDEKPLKTRALIRSHEDFMDDSCFGKYFLLLFLFEVNGKMDG
jgi:hypothetical protein